MAENVGKTCRDKKPSRVVRGIAVLQIAAGLTGFVFLSLALPELFQDEWIDDLTSVLICGTSVFAGFRLWVGSRLGYMLSAVIQLIQVATLEIEESVIYEVLLPLRFAVGLSIDYSERTVFFGLSSSFGAFSDFSAAWPPDTVKINLLALGFLMILARKARNLRQPLD